VIKYASLKSWDFALAEHNVAAMTESNPDAAREIYFEFTGIGRNVKVSAIDAATGLEVSIVGPATASQANLQRLALQKLLARLKAGT
jgi:hypothetical protein